MMDGELEGRILDSQEPSKTHEPKRSYVHRIVAPLLSLMLPGVGQLYNRHWVKGIVFLLVVLSFSGWLRRELIETGASSVSVLPHSPYTVTALVVLLGLGIWSIFDAYRDARWISHR